MTGAHDPAAIDSVLQKLLSFAAKAIPGAEALAEVNARSSANTRFAQNEITSCGDFEELEPGIIIAVGRRHAQALTNQTDDASLRALVDRVATMAKLAPEDPEWVGVLAAQPAERQPPDAWDAATADRNPKLRADAAAAAIAEAERAGLLGAGFLENTATTRALASSAGLHARWRSTFVHFSMTSRTPDGTGSGWAGTSAGRLADLDVPALARVATQKATASAHPRPLEPGRYTVILEPAATCELLSFLTSALGARDADEGRSFFTKPGGGTRLGEKLFADTVTLRSNPFDPTSPDAPFDEDGLPLRPTTWIEKGTLSALAYTRYWAKKQGKAPTGSHTSHHLEPGATASVDALLSGVKRGVLITRFWYTRWVDPQAVLITGLTRDGVWLIEDGRIAAPVNNFRFNESPVTVLRNVDAMTQTLVRSESENWRAPSLRTHEFNLASRSDAV